MESGMKLLDTTFLIHYWGGRAAVEAYLEAHEHETFITTPINLKELAVGRRLQGLFDPNRLTGTFGWVEVVPFDVVHAYAASELEAELWADDHVNRDQINAIGVDLLIAAVAMVEGATVVTRNIDDFERFGVQVERY